jgi:RNA polymerase sigma factor for flagellar operon FliA
MKTKSKNEKNESLNANQRKLVVEHYPLVQKVVNSIRSRLPAHADLDELHSAGVGGLVDASMKLKPEKAESFGAYASMRIRGAIMDELRRLDYMPRSARQDAKRITKTRDELEQNLGREASDDEVREAMDLSQKQFTKVLRRTQNFSFLSLNDDSTKNGETRDLGEIIPDENAQTAVEKIERRELSGLLKSRLGSLPEKQRLIIERYYFEEKKLAEIAEEFGVSEARICQIHAQAIKSLRAKFKN